MTAFARGDDAAPIGQRQRLARAFTADAAERVQELGSTVASVARRYAGVARARGVLLDADDLAQAGAVAVATAARTYDSTRGVQFKTYARVAIARRMLSAIQRGDEVSERSRRLLRGIADAGRELDARNPRHASVLAQLRARYTVRLDAPAYDDRPDGPAVVEQLAGPSPDPFDAVSRAADRELLDNAIALLPTTVGAVIRGLFFDDADRATIALELGLTVKAVDGARSRGLSKLREYIRILERGEKPVVAAHAPAVKRNPKPRTYPARPRSAPVPAVPVEWVDLPLRRQRIRVSAQSELRRLAGRRTLNRASSAFGIAQTLHELLAPSGSDRGSVG